MKELPKLNVSDVLGEHVLFIFLKNSLIIQEENTKEITTVKRVYIWYYRFLLIYIHFNFDVLDLDTTNFQNFLANKLTRWVVF